MRDLAILSFVSLDGVMQSPSAPEEDPSGGFALGGWAAPLWDEVMPQVEQVAMSEPYDILFGRKTYDIFAGHWPDAPKSDIADRLNTACKYVVTSRPVPPKWRNTCQISDDPVQEIRKLKSGDGPLLQVHGSAALIQMLLAHDLIDEFRIWTFPVVLGQGKRLFENGTAPRKLVHRQAGSTASGVTMHISRAE